MKSRHISDIVDPKRMTHMRHCSLAKRRCAEANRNPFPRPHLSGYSAWRRAGGGKSPVHGDLQR
jgi:hypothetical protein